MLADTLRIINASFGILLLPVLYIRLHQIKYCTKLDFSQNGFFALMSIGVSVNAIYSLGRPFNFGIIFISSGLLGLFFTGVLRAYQHFLHYGLSCK